MRKILNRIEECDDGKHTLIAEDKRNIVAIHKFHVPGIHDAAGVARFYRHNPEWTGGQMPYTIVIDSYGTVEQALQLLDLGPHARRWNTSAIGVACIQHDFSVVEPPKEQWEAAVGIVAELVAWMGGGVEAVVKGHSELPGGSSDPKKDCPGHRWDMDRFRLDVLKQMLSTSEILRGHPNKDVKREIDMLNRGFVF